jgi:NADPH:quinone reductase-like Zn-dependent oxidoreductase
MRNLVVFGAQGGTPLAAATTSVQIDRLTLGCAVLDTPPPGFDGQAAAGQVLVQVRAFSCNYRDRGLIQLMARLPAQRHFALGSEFAGEVVAVDRAVSSLRPGDLVMPNHHYVDGVGPPGGPREGVVTNCASRELQLFDHRQLTRVPPGMSPEQAAGFSLGAQTAVSMIRKAAVGPGDRVLVMGGRSNTSLFLIQLLRSQGVMVQVTNTTAAFDDRLAALGAGRCHSLGAHREGFPGAPALRQQAAGEGGFAAVLDPFCDLHLGLAVEVLAPSGRYVTCGFAGQNPALAAAAGPVRVDPGRVFQAAIVKNLSIIGNCLGVRGDLDRALDVFAAGGVRPVIDSVFTGDQAAAFLERSFNDRQRFGKVVFRYSP